MEEKYFNHYAQTNGANYNFKNIFISQDITCNKVKRLEDSRSNPLTIRLCQLQDAFYKLFDLRRNIRQRVSNNRYIYHPEFNVTISGTTSSITVSDNSIGEEFNLGIHDVYSHFYTFTSYFCSALDRLAFEVHLVYGIGEENTIDWRKFKRKNNKTGELFDELKSKNSNLADIIYGSNFSEVFSFRDKLEHGKNDLEINGSSELNSNFDFVIGGNEKMRMIDFCQEKFAELLRICEEIYKVMF